MSKITIKPVTSTSVLVRSKVVYRDTADNWIAVSELTPSEAEAFARYLREYIDTNKPMTEQTFNI